MAIPKKYQTFFEASYRSYDGLSAESKVRTSRAEWIALKLGVSVNMAQKYINSYAITVTP